MLTEQTAVTEQLPVRLVRTGGPCAHLLRPAQMRKLSLGSLSGRTLGLPQLTPKAGR